MAPSGCSSDLTRIERKEGIGGENSFVIRCFLHLSLVPLESSFLRLFHAVDASVSSPPGVSVEEEERQEGCLFPERSESEGEEQTKRFIQSSITAFHAPQGQQA